MSEKDIMQIRVGSHAVSIIGIRMLMAEMAQSHADKPDDEVGEIMLERLGTENYISNNAREEYGRAFVREFRKFLGRPCEKESPTELDIKVLGPGCPACDHLEQVVMQVLEELHLPASLEHVRDFKEIAKYRVLGTPALVINGRVVSKGASPTRERIKQWLAEAAPGKVGA